MSALTVNPAYTALLARTPPKIIRTEAENEAYVEAVYELERRHESLSAEERELAELLTLLIEKFEDQQYRLPHTSAAGTVSFLLEQRGASMEELSSVLGDEHEAEAVLAGGPLTTEQIRLLSGFFHVSPEVFF